MGFSAAIATESPRKSKLTKYFPSRECNSPWIDSESEMMVVLIPHPRRRHPYAKFERLASRAHTDSEELEAAPAIYMMMINTNFVRFLESTRTPIGRSPTGNPESLQGPIFR